MQFREAYFETVSSKAKSRKHTYNVLLFYGYVAQFYILLQQSNDSYGSVACHKILFAVFSRRTGAAQCSSYELAFRNVIIIQA